MNSLLSFDSFYPRRSEDDVRWIRLEPNVDAELSLNRTGRKKRKVAFLTRLFRRISKKLSSFSCMHKVVES